MSEKIRVGILGCAQIAKRSLAPAFLAHPAFELVAVASRTPEKAADFISSLATNSTPTPTSYTYDELINSSYVDLIYCPLPTGLHHEWVMKALKAGKHVLCEKSLASNYKQAQELIREAKARKRFLMESFQFRFHAQNLYVKELLAKRAIGKLRQVVIRFGIPPFPDGASNIRYSEKLGGGALLDNGAYIVKCATCLLGSNLQILSSVTGDENPELGGVELTGTMSMLANYQAPNDTAKQRLGVHAAYGFDHFYQNGYEIWGSEGKITTTRAFTAREDFAAPVILETKTGREERTFKDDHFARLLDYIAKTIPSGDYDAEYRECHIQAAYLNHAYIQSLSHCQISGGL